MRKNIALAGLVLALGISAVQGEAVAAGDATVHVTDVEQLYAAVNNPANVGATVVMASGIYSLSATNAAKAARPNGGRLELQQDMSLSGVTGDRSAVVIDATSLPASSFTVSFGRTGVLRIGRGSNTVEWLTVLGNSDAAAGIATELTGTASTRIRVAHVVSGGSSRGIDVRNAGAEMIGRWIEAEIIDNEFIGPAQVVGVTEGIRLANFVGADRGVIVATLSGNRVHGFQLGCIVANNRSSSASIHARSSGDRFFANAGGALIAGGLSQATTGVANSNTTVFEAYGSEFVDNTVSSSVPAMDPRGIRVVGGNSMTQTNAASNNTVLVSLSGSKVAGNQGADFDAFGAMQQALSGIAGTNNRATIALRGVSTKINISTVDSSPVEPSGSNTVSVTRSPVVDAIGPGRFSNFSAQASVGAGRSVTVGFVVEGTGQKNMLIRGIGPGLAQFGMRGALADPAVAVISSTGERLAENDNWPAALANVFASTGAFALPAGSKDAAVLLPLQPGAYSVVLRGADGGAGEALIEVYDVP